MDGPNNPCRVQLKTTRRVFANGRRSPCWETALGLPNSASHCKCKTSYQVSNGFGAVCIRRSALQENGNFPWYSRNCFEIDYKCASILSASAASLTTVTSVLHSLDITPNITACVLTVWAA